MGLRLDTALPPPVADRSAPPVPRPSQQLDSRTGIVTPENIAFEYRAAGPFTRMGAYLIDIGIQVLIVVLSIFVIMLSMMAIMASMSAGSVSIWTVLGNLGAFTVLVLWFLMQWFYGALFELWWNGQTPGKRMLGLRVLQVDGRPINAQQAILRNLIRFLDAQPPLPATGELLDALVFVAPVALSTHLAGFTAAALTSRHQRLGDLACGTMVVAEDRVFVASVEPISDEQVAKVLESLPAGFVPSRSLTKAVAHYIGRRRYFGPARRQEIAGHVGRVLAERLNLPADTDYDLLMAALYMRALGGGAAEDRLERPQQKPDQPVPSPPNATVVGEDEPTDWDAVPLG